MTISTTHSKINAEIEALCASAGHAGSWHIEARDDDRLMLVWEIEADEAADLGDDYPWKIAGGDALIESSGLRQIDAGSDSYTDKYGDAMVSQWVMLACPARKPAGLQERPAIALKLRRSSPSHIRGFLLFRFRLQPPMQDHRVGDLLGMFPAHHQRHRFARVPDRHEPGPRHHRHLGFVRLRLERATIAPLQS